MGVITFGILRIIRHFPCMGILIWVIALSALLSGQVLGPDPEHVDFKGPEGWATRYFGSIVLPAGFGVPRRMNPGEWELGLEASHVPQLSLEKQRVGFSGSKVDDLNHARVLVRPSATIGVGGGFSVTATAVPKVRLWGLRSGLFSLSLNRPFWDHGNWRMGGRLFFNYAQSEGAFTCSQWLVDEGLDPFDCSPPSRDTSYLRAWGVEFSISHDLEAFYGWSPYLSVSWQHMNNHFQTDVEVFGGTAHDARTLKTEGSTFAASAGVEMPVGERWTLVWGIFYSPLKVVRAPIVSDAIRNDELFHFRSQIRYRF